MTMKMNSKLVVRMLTFLVLLTLIAGALFDASGQTGRRRRGRRRVTRVVTPAVQFYTVPVNTVIRVRMDTELNSRDARIGDRFTTTVEEPVYGGSSGVEVVPVGSRIGGRVTQVNRAGKRTPGNRRTQYARGALGGGGGQRPRLLQAFRPIAGDPANSGPVTVYAHRIRRRSPPEPQPKGAHHASHVPRRTSHSRPRRSRARPRDRRPGLAEKLETAYGRGARILALEIDERLTILRALEDGPPTRALSELRGLLLQEHTARIRYGLVDPPEYSQ